MSNDYTVQALVDRVTLKAFTSTSTSLSPQQIVDLLNDSLRSYIVPTIQTLREEFWVGKTDIVLVTDSAGRITIPDSVASTLRTVAWNNAGIITPLARIEPEAAFAYLSQQGNLPVGFELRGYTLRVLPAVPGISVHLSAMLRPPQMVLDSEAGEVESHASAALTLVDVPLAWQSETPDSVDIISAQSPFSVVAEEVSVVSLVGSVLTLSSFTGDDGDWVSDPGSAPFANTPIELYPLLEQDVITTLFQALGDKRLKGAEDRKKELEGLIKRTMSPRTSGNSRPIVNYSAPGMNRGGRRW